LTNAKTGLTEVGSEDMKWAEEVKNEIMCHFVVSVINISDNTKLLASYLDIYQLRRKFQRPGTHILSKTLIIHLKIP
jgi:hypothetical protein